MQEQFWETDIQGECLKSTRNTSGIRMKGQNVPGIVDMLIQECFVIASTSLKTLVGHMNERNDDEYWSEYLV